MRRFPKINKGYYIILISWMLCICSLASAQSGKIPPFVVIQSNGKVFKAQDLPMGKPIIIIYFSPECDHCDHLMKELFKRPTDFANASIAMITYLSIEKVLKFVNQYNLNKYPNIYVGTEGNSFFVRNYYKITDMPFIALYTKNGDLVKSYMKDVAIKDLSDRLHSLK